MLILSIATFVIRATGGPSKDNQTYKEDLIYFHFLVSIDYL